MNKKDYHSDDYQYFAADNLVVGLAVPGKPSVFVSLSGFLGADGLDSNL